MTGISRQTARIGEALRVYATDDQPGLARHTGRLAGWTPTALTLSTPAGDVTIAAAQLRRVERSTR